MSSEPFDFLSLPCATRFAEAFSPEGYFPLPDDWSVVVTDVVDSTGAVRDGRYKDVNTLGAACITATINVVGGTSLPFAFGGDGASLVCPPALLGAVLDELCAVSRFGREYFGLEMRVGAVSVAELRQAGKDVRVARLELSPGNSLALFSGGGLALADRLIKGNAEGRYLRDPEAGEGMPNLEGLSCRWQPLKAQNGVILTLLVRSAEEQRYAEIVERLQQILGGSGVDLCPVKPRFMRLRSLLDGFQVELLARHAAKGFNPVAHIGLFVGKVLQNLAHMAGLRIGPYEPKRYLEELRANSDFRKFDDMLRMVVDCPEAAVAEVRTYLEKEQGEREKGELSFGLHVSSEALMTCLMLDLRASQHLHFIDGADGGYALAAADLKGRTERPTGDAKP